MERRIGISLVKQQMSGLTMEQRVRWTTARATPLF